MRRFPRPPKPADKDNPKPLQKPKGPVSNTLSHELHKGDSTQLGPSAKIRSWWHRITSGLGRSRSDRVIRPYRDEYDLLQIQSPRVERASLVEPDLDRRLEAEAGRLQRENSGAFPPTAPGSFGTETGLTAYDGHDDHHALQSVVGWTGTDGRTSLKRHERPEVTWVEEADIDGQTRTLARTESERLYRNYGRWTLRKQFVNKAVRKGVTKADAAQFQRDMGLDPAECRDMYEEFERQIRLRRFVHDAGHQHGVSTEYAQAFYRNNRVTESERRQLEREIVQLLSDQQPQHSGNAGYTPLQLPENPFPRPPFPVGEIPIAERQTSTQQPVIGAGISATDELPQQPDVQPESDWDRASVGRVVTPLEILFAHTPLPDLHFVKRKDKSETLSLWRFMELLRQDATPSEHSRSTSLKRPLDESESDYASQISLIGNSDDPPEDCGPRRSLRGGISLEDDAWDQMMRESVHEIAAFEAADRSKTSMGTFCGLPHRTSPLYRLMFTFERGMALPAQYEDDRMVKLRFQQFHPTFIGLALLCDRELIDNVIAVSTERISRRSIPYPRDGSLQWVFLPCHSSNEFYHVQELVIQSFVITLAACGVPMRAIRPAWMMYRKHQELKDIKKNLGKTCPCLRKFVGGILVAMKILALERDTTYERLWRHRYHKVTPSSYHLLSNLEMLREGKTLGLGSFNPAFKKPPAKSHVGEPTQPPDEESSKSASLYEEQVSGQGHDTPKPAESGASLSGGADYTEASDSSEDGGVALERTQSETDPNVQLLNRLDVLCKQLDTNVKENKAYLEGFKKTTAEEEEEGSEEEGSEEESEEEESEEEESEEEKSGEEKSGEEEEEDAIRLN